MINLPTLYVLWKEYHQIDDKRFDDKDIIPSFVSSLKEPEEQQKEWVNFYRLHGVM